MGISIDEIEGIELPLEFAGLLVTSEGKGALFQGYLAGVADYLHSVTEKERLRKARQYKSQVMNRKNKRKKDFGRSYALDQLELQGYTKGQRRAESQSHG